MKALILDGKVVDVSAEEFEVHESLSWVDCGDEVRTGFDYDGSIFIDPNADTRTDEEIATEKLSYLRRERDRKLAETDWWASSDLTMTQAQTDYRQALRDITDTYTSLDDVVWPEKP